MSDCVDLNKITAEVITDLSKTVAKKIFDKATFFIHDMKSKDEIDFGLAFEEYLNYTADLYSKIKIRKLKSVFYLLHKL